MRLQHDFRRRHFLQSIVGSASALAVSQLFGRELTPTVQMTEGPFYPDKLPLDTDNDLLIINQSDNPALGEITHLSGRILNEHGDPLRNAFVEIWQVDQNGVYLHTQDAQRGGNDANFQGYGRFLTDPTGRYYFRTIKPVPYTGRTPHIHFAVSQNGKRILTTQLLIKDHPQNEDDGVFRSIRDANLRDTVLREFKPIAESKIGELTVDFDLVMGHTYDENAGGPVKGGIAKSNGMGRPPFGPGGPGGRRGRPGGPGFGPPPTR